MALKLLVGLVLTPWAAAVHDGVPDMDVKCHSLLTAMSASPHSTTELSMICRAHLPMSLCHSAVRELGQKPWSRAKVDHTCARWEDQWTARELQMAPAERKLDAVDFQAQIDDIMAKKAAVGLCKDQTINECAAYKKEEYPKYQSELNDVYKQKRGGVSDSIKESTEQTSDAIEDASEKTSDAIEDASEKTSDAIDEISSKASEAVEDVSEGTSDAIDEISSKTSDTLKDATSKVSDAKRRRAQQKERVVRKLEDTTQAKKEPATGGVEEATGDATEAVDEAVEDATEEVDSAEVDSVEDVAEEVDSEEVDSAASEASDAVTDAVSEAPSEDGNPMDRIKPRRADQKYQTLGKISPVSSSPFMLAAAGAAALAIAGAALIIARRRKARGLVTVPRAVPELQPIE